MMRETLPAPARPALLLSMFAAALLASAPSSAADYPARDIGNWTVAAGQDGKGCFLTRIYGGPGETTLLFGLDIDGSHRLSVLNANWSIREKDRQSLNFRLSNASFPKHYAIGIAADGKRGFVTDFGTKFPALFAASRSLHVSRGDMPVARLNLEGSGAAVAELRKCVDLHRVKPAPAARDADQVDGIPIDPFAPAAKRRSKKWPPSRSHFVNPRYIFQSNQ